MKPANFPARKNARRLRALKRLAANHPDAARLQRRLTSEAVARSIRTKKDRSARAKLRGAHNA